MLSQQEIMNNAFKEMLAREQMLANKYSELQQQITDPKIQKMLQGIEMASRTRQSLLTQKMSGFGIV